MKSIFDEVLNVGFNTIIYENGKEKVSFFERNQNIQTNLTNKFIRTLRRLCAQNHSLEIVAYPYEQDEFLTLSLFPEKREINNELLEDADRHVKNHLGK